MAKEYGELHGEVPAILVAIDATVLAHALKNRLGSDQYSVFGTSVKKVFAGLTPQDETRVLIRMSHTALAPGEEVAIDYMGMLDQVWLDPPVDQTTPHFYATFEEYFGAPWQEVSGQPQRGSEKCSSYYGVRAIRYLRSPIRIGELRSWSDGSFFVPNHRIRRPIRVIWEESLLDRLGA